MVCPTAEPTATPAAVVAIWANIPGCLGAAAGAPTAEGGACVGAGAYEGGGAALAIGGGAALAIGGGDGGARLQRGCTIPTKSITDTMCMC